MQNMTDAERGWAFASQMLGVNMSTQAASSYVAQVNTAIDNLKNDLMGINTGLTDARVGGFAAESWHAGTFNVNAAAAASDSFAVAGKPGTDSDLGRNNYGSVDVRVVKADGSIVDYGSKYDQNYKITAKEQATPNPETGAPKYTHQKRLVPSDQVDSVRDYATNRANNPKTPENWAKGYAETSEAVDRISDGEIESKPLSKAESEELAREIRKDQVDLKKHGVSANEAIKPEYIMQQAAKAGLSAAVVTMIMQTAPEIYKAISYLIKTGELDLNQIKRIGTKAITSGAEGFLRGSIACTLQVLCEKGAFGAALKAVDATILGTVVALTLETVKNSILVAAGKMTPKQMGGALVDSILISTGYVVGAKIGGVIGQALGFELPVIGYILGSLVGCAFAAVYNIGKKKLISFCVDTGFTCFGLVEQDYTIPEEALRTMGIDVIPIARTEINYTNIDRTQLSSGITHTTIETIDIHMLRRGIIGVNRVGYVC